jgi:putative oxidoreductase
MKNILLGGNDGYAPLFIRIALGGVIFGHGAQKLFGWFGGFGFEGTMNYFTEQRDLPWIIGFTVIMIEFFGAVAVIIGALTRLWALGIMCVMGAVILTTFNDHIFMNWFGSQKEEGYEFFLLAIGMSISLVVSGGGRLSIDKLLGRENKKENKPISDKYSIAA